VVDYYDLPITEQQAVQRRRLGLDVVVRNGDREWANRPKGKPSHVASVHGAIASGIQVAREVVASLRN
jgi:hypothetical protein